MATGYDYATDDNSNFTKVKLPTGIDSNGMFRILDPVNGPAVVAEGVEHVFTVPVNSFGIRDISPAVDGEDPLAFPTFLEFDQMAVRFTMTPIPEPATQVLLAIGAMALGCRRLRQSG